MGERFKGSPVQGSEVQGYFSAAPGFMIPYWKSDIGYPLFFIALIEALLAWWGVRWWSGDDPQLIKHAISHPYPAFFFSPDAWRELTASNLTPLVSLSYKLDWDLFGLSPHLFYLHQFISCFLVLLLFFVLCRQWLSPLGAFVSVCVFMLSRPMLEALDFLMLRHYVEGLALSLGAVLCYLKSLSQPGRPLFWSVTAGILYLFACTAKEIFVPLPLCLIALPVKDWKLRLSRIYPVAAVLFLYIFWRWWMLGSPGGYGEPVKWSQAFLLPVQTLNAIGWEGMGALLSVLAVSVIVFVSSKKGGRLFILVGATVAILPLLPVSGMMTSRYAFLPALFLAALIGSCVDRVRGKGGSRAGKRVAIVLALAGLGYLSWSNLIVWRPDLRQGIAQAKVEGEYVLSRGHSHEFIRNPAGPPWFYHGLGWLRKRVLNLPLGPRAFWDPVALTDKKRYTILAYDPTGSLLYEDREYTKMVDQYLSAIRYDTPLRITVRYNEPVVTWDLGPWEKGEYAFLFENDYQLVLPVSRRGMARFRFTEDRVLRVRYKAPEGWISYSPALPLKIESGAATIEWAR